MWVVYNIGHSENLWTAELKSDTTIRKVHPLGQRERIGFPYRIPYRRLLHKEASGSLCFKVPKDFLRD